jgi:hypothetical protein
MSKKHLLAAGAALAMLGACQQPAATPVAAPDAGAAVDVAADSATGGNAAEPAPSPSPMATSADAGGSGAVGPLRFRYDPAKLAPVKAEVSVPPDWAVKLAGTKLVAADRAAMIGKADCMYGQSGEATRCNAGQEAGLAFAIVDQPLETIAARLSGEERRGIKLAGVDGYSWQIGAEGEGAEHILLPAGKRTVLIVRHFRESGNADEAAVREVLASLSIAP